MHCCARLNTVPHVDAIKITVLVQEWLMVNVSFRPHDVIKDSPLLGSAWQIDFNQLCTEFLQGFQGAPKRLLYLVIESLIKIRQRYAHADVLYFCGQILQAIV